MTEPALAQLGSTLLVVSQAHEKQRPAPASSGSAAIDEVLYGGFRYGEITSVAGASGTGKTLIAYQAIASHLLAQHSEVAFIDTNGSFSPLRLLDVLIFRLRARLERERYSIGSYEKTSEPIDDTVKVATSMLDRVKVTRVFDLSGVVEAVGEVAETRQLESASNRREIGGSEDVGRNTPSRIGMIIVDTITNVVSSAVSKSHIQGQALMTSLMRSLGHLIRRRHICTILVNAAVGLSQSNDPEHQRRPADNVSIFASTLGRPALGKAFTYFIDTSIFLSALPKSRDDAAAAYGGPQGQTWEKALVLEVLKDRGSREGRWVAFLDLKVKLIPCYT